MRQIVLFDGDCHFCSKAVQFILKHEKESSTYFASLQSEIGQDLLSLYKVDISIDSFVFIQDDKVYIESTAALQLAKELKGIWSLGALFLIVPAFLRDPIYRLIAKYRYKFNRDNKACKLLTKEEKKRFLS